MAQINITLSTEDILGLLASNRVQGFRKLLEESLNSILNVEADEQIKAKPYERTEERTDYRNGTRERQLETRLGSITLKVPRFRDVPFRSLVFDNYSRSEAALISVMAEMVVCGVSTRKISNVMEKLCGATPSKSAVSEVCKDLDQSVEEFKNRKITNIYPFVLVDATYFKVRENHKIVSKALFVAMGYNSDGIQEILGFEAYPTESDENWGDFMRTLQRRGLHGLKMMTTDANPAIRHALYDTFPGVPWQRCQYHFAKDILKDVPKKYQEGLRTELTKMFHCKKLEEARKRKDEIYSDYLDVAPQAMKCLDEGFEDAMTVLLMPEKLQRNLRTSNRLERINRELKRRSKVIGIFPNQASLLRIIGSVLMEENEKISNRRELFSQTTLKEVQSPETSEKLRKVAFQQKQLMEAA